MYLYKFVYDVMALTLVPLSFLNKSQEKLDVLGKIFYKSFEHIIQTAEESGYTNLKSLKTKCC